VWGVVLLSFSARPCLVHVRPTLCLICPVSRVFLLRASFIILHQHRPPHSTHHPHTYPFDTQHSGDSWIECREVASGRTLFYHATTMQIAFDAKPGAGGVVTRTLLCVYLCYLLCMVLCFFIVHVYLSISFRLALFRWLLVGRLSSCSLLVRFASIANCSTFSLMSLSHTRTLSLHLYLSILSQGFVVCPDGLGGRRASASRARGRDTRQRARQAAGHCRHRMGLYEW
jgi:hypothetical protein